MTIDLTNWKLTLPVDSKGKFTKGKAAEIKPIPDGYSKSPYFFYDHGPLVFSTPVEGATTGGSKYSRTELRELRNGKEASWKIAEGGRLYGLLRVYEVPKTEDKKPGRIVIGQIHGPDDELCRLYYDDGTIYFYDDKAGSKKKETKFTLVDANGVTTSIKLGEEFSYEILVADGKLKVIVVTEKDTYVASEVISSFWTKKSLYFKAGLYLGVGKPGSGAGTIGTGRGTVAFTEIVVSHP